LPFGSATGDFPSGDDKAIAQGIPVVCVDADVPNSKRYCYRGRIIQSRQRKREADGGAHPGRGTLWSSAFRQGNLDERVAGVADALKNFPR